jgi:GNAT superfamily N-acetyltransferase
MEKLQVISTSYGDRHWATFVKLPWAIYRKDAAWVPPLLYEQDKMLHPRKNPFFKTAAINYWIAMRGLQPVGRIAAVIDTLHNRHYGEQTGFFGYFESFDDQEAVEALTEAAESWLTLKGMRKVMGPVNLATANECGLLIEGFDTGPFLQMTHNPVYYERLLMGRGYEKEIDLLAYYTPATIVENTVVMDRLKKLHDHILQKHRIRFRQIDKKQFNAEVETIRTLYNDFMGDNWGFIPIDRENFSFMTSSMKEILDSDLAFFAEVDGRPVGFSVGIPNVNEVIQKMDGKLFPFGLFKYLYYRKKISAFRVMLMGVSEAYRRKGIEAVFIYKTIMAGVSKNFKGAELSWVMETNKALISELEFLQSEPYKRYRILSKTL